MALSVDAEYIVLSKTEDEEFRYFMFDSEEIQNRIGIQTQHSHDSYILFKPSDKESGVSDEYIDLPCKLCDQNMSDIRIADVFQEGQSYYLRNSSHICKHCRKKYKERIKNIIDQSSKEIATELL